MSATPSGSTFRLAHRLAALGVVFTMAACAMTPASSTTEATPSAPPPAPEPVRAHTHNPTEEFIHIAPSTAAERAAATAYELFSAAPIVVLDDGGDAHTSLRAAGTAVALGVPLLIAGTAESLSELQRLGTETALAFGTATLPAEVGGIDLLAAPHRDADLAALLDLPLAEPRQPAAQPGLRDIAGLTTDELPVWEAPTPVPSPPPPSVGTSPVRPPVAKVDDVPATLPPREATVGVDGVLVLTRGVAEDLAAVATARAAGADIVVATDPDPRASAEVVADIAAADAGHTIVLGEDWGDLDTLRWRLDTAATGVQLPGGGQLVLPGKHYVALYGNPVTPVLGVLGEQDTAQTIGRAREYAAQYDELLPGTVIPALEIIATVAAANPGNDGNYSTLMAPQRLAPLVEAAGDAEQYVVLDLQPGRSSFLEQAQRYEEFLRLPHVGLALDPEWNLGPTDRHLVRIGSASAAEINEVIDWLADLTREHALPQKLLVLHQFQLAMITDIEELDLDRSEVAVLIHADGQGSQPAKQATWRALHANAPHIQWWGWKNFYDEDSPMLTPEQVVDQVDPLPDFISYQ